MAEVFDINLEADLSEFTSTTTDGGDLSWSNDVTAQAVAGTAGAMKMLIDDTNAIYGQINFNNSATVRFRFYIDPNTLTRGAGENFAVLIFAQVSSGQRIAATSLNQGGTTGYRLENNVYNDAGGVDVSVTTDISDAPHYVEFLIVRAATDVSGDGSAQVWIDGVSVGSDATIDNYNRMSDQNWRIRAGAVEGLDAGTSGTFYIDEIKANDDGSEIGPLAVESASVSPSESPSVSPSLSPSASESPSESPSVSPSVSPSESSSISPSVSPSESPSFSPSASESPSVSPSESPSISPSASASPSESPSVSPSESPSLSPSVSESPSESPSVSPSLSPSVSPSQSPSLSPSSSESPSISPSISPSESPSVSPSASPSVSPSESPSLSPSVSESPSVSPSESPSISPSVSPSISPSPSPEISGTVCWGHVTGVIEDNIRTFANHWTGTGVIENAGDAERICLDAGEYMESELVDTGAVEVELYQNLYDISGDDVLLRYRTGATPAACLAAAWNNYTVPFTSLGIVQVRLESTL